jgi:poly(3-hydroxybutyrate) depolymerase
MLRDVANSKLPYSPYGHHEQKPEHGSYPPHTSGCGKHHSHDGQLETISIPTHNGPREFSIWVPPSYNKHNNTPVILSFHGSDMNSAEQAQLSGLNDSSVNPDMIAVFPQAIDVSVPSPRWRTPDHLAPLIRHVVSTDIVQQCVWQGTRENPVNDLQFTRQMLYYLQENYCVDNNRLYADGFNIGGGFVDHLACSEESGKYFAAFAMVSPAQYPYPLYPKHEKPQCKPTRPYPILEREYTFLGRTAMLLTSIQSLFSAMNPVTTMLRPPMPKLS